jgi:hypothetical protein
VLICLCIENFEFDYPVAERNLPRRKRVRKKVMIYYWEHILLDVLPNCRSFFIWPDRKEPFDPWAEKYPRPNATDIFGMLLMIIAHADMQPKTIHFPPRIEPDQYFTDSVRIDHVRLGLSFMEKENLAECLSRLESISLSWSPMHLQAEMDIIIEDQGTPAEMMKRLLKPLTNLKSVYLESNVEDSTSNEIIMILHANGIELEAKRVGYTWVAEGRSKDQLW